MEQTISIVVRGKVQGVFFRQSTREKAIELSLTGKVYNQPDGSVQVIATGLAEQLALLTAWCRQGPPKARVSDTEVRPLPLQYFDSFIIER